MGNKTSEDTLFKSRSIGACIKSGFCLYTTNFKNIFKTTWPAALVYAIFCAILSTYDYIATGKFYIFGLLSLIICGGLAEIVFYSYGMMQLDFYNKHHIMAKTRGRLLYKYNKQGVKWQAFNPLTIALILRLPIPSTKSKTARRIRQKASLFYNINIGWRFIRTALFCLMTAFLSGIMLFLVFELPIMLKPEAFINQTNIIFLIVALVFVAIIIVIFLLPLIFISFKYVMQRKVHFWKQFRSNYAIGLRYLPQTITIMLVNLIVILFASIIILLPAIILGMAKAMSDHGASLGDPLGMPDNIAMITAITFLLAGFLSAYIRMSALFPLFYLYGSIETRENERCKFGKMREVHQSALSQQSETFDGMQKDKHSIRYHIK